MTTTAKKPGARYRAATQWIEDLHSAGTITSEQLAMLWKISDECRVLEVAAVNDSLEIAQAATEFAQLVVSSGSVSSTPTRYRSYSDLTVTVAKLEVSVTSLKSLIWAILGHDGHSKLVSIIS